MLVRGRGLLVGAVAALASVIGATIAHAEFPDRPVTMVVPYGPGSAIDGVARALSQAAQENLGQPVIVENRTGAGGALGTTYVGRRPADGYTVGIVSINPFVISYLSKTLPLHPVNDFTHVISTGVYLQAVAVKADSPLKRIEDLVEAIRKEPGKLTYSTSGTASTGFLNFEEFSRLQKVKALHIPYKSGAEAITALLSGDVDFYADAAWAPMYAAGRLRPLLIFSDKRAARYPDVPVPPDLGSGNVQPGYLFLVAPKGLPAPVLARLHRAFEAALATPAYRSVLERYNMVAMNDGPEKTREGVAAAIPSIETMFTELGLGSQ